MCKKIQYTLRTKTVNCHIFIIRYHHNFFQKCSSNEDLKTIVLIVQKGYTYITIYKMRHGCCVMVDDRVYKFHMHLMYGLTLAKRGRGGG